MTRRLYPDAPTAAVSAIIFDRGRVLLVRRGHEPLKGAWSLPGGAIELGETLEKAVRREIREETGLEVEPLRIVAVLDRITPDDRGSVKYHYVLVSYECTLTGGVLKCASDAEEAVWFDFAALEGAGLEEDTLAIIYRALGGGSAPVSA